MKTTILLTTITLQGALILEAAEGHWPQWRGPNLDGTVAASGLPVEWNETKNVVWKTRLPWWSGSTPVVWGDRIFLTSPAAASVAATVAPPAGARRGRGLPDGGGPPRSPRLDPGGNILLLLCLDRKDGGILWTREIDEGNQLMQKHNSASPSPVTDGRHVWVLTGNGTLACLTMTGEKVWTRHIQEDYGRFGLNHGYGSSPLLYRDYLIVPVLHGMKTDEPSYILALNKATGETIWKTERPTDALQESPDAYVTPQLLEADGRTEIILNGGDIVTGHDITTGRELWRADVLNPNKGRFNRIVPSCVIVGDIIIAPTRVNPLTALRSGGEGDVTQTHVLWQFGHGPDVPTPVSDGKYLWTIAGTQSLLSCLDVRTGEALYAQQRLPAGTYSSSLVLADGKIYITNEDAVTTVVAASPEFRVLATNSLDGSFTLSSPVVVGNQILVRTGEH
jgi:outer membrane protein assembly factor BamB